MSVVIECPLTAVFIEKAMQIAGSKKTFKILTNLKKIPSGPSMM